jgi:peptide/nickel transport system permease protein
MFDFHRPEEPLLYARALARHMVLPVLALLLSLLFQLVYTWRTFFIIYSEEDYVDLARAKGLETKALEKQYILKPALPYVITSFATSLIGFWQLTVALERIFQWPGLGVLYIQALPNYWHETVEYGDLMIVVQIVVTFSYILGILAFILDLVYVIVDPRIHLVPASSLAQVDGRIKTKRKRGDGLLAWMRGTAPVLTPPVRRPVKRRRASRGPRLRGANELLKETGERSKLFLQQLRRFPSAIFGLLIICLLLAGSFYAIIFLPYEQIGRDYDANRSTGRNLVPRTAAPLWFNVFGSKPLLSTLIMDENSGQTKISSVVLENGWVQKTVTFQFNYAYREIPSDVLIYLDSKYAEKIPFVSMQWTTPDGRTIQLKSRAVAGEDNYDLQAGLNIAKLINEKPEWKSWFVTDGQYPTPGYYLLFAKPGSTQPVPQAGTYQLEVTSLLFGNGDDVKPQLVLLGQVYGWAGTDYWRRDLIVPLFWGMPFTLLVGFIGTFITTLIAMLLPAIGVWYGGGLDHFIQRLTEVNMVLPGLAIAVLMNAVFGIHIWIVLGIVVVLNAFGAPIKSFRSAFLQAKEAPYIEMARAYGASDFRIISRYLMPRILPVLIPTLVAQIPSFIFLEATLGFFNIKTIYPSWGRIIYDGLSRGALYGSPFWVLEPIFLLLLTGLAFAMLGSALERILNPRILDITDSKT